MAIQKTHIIDNNGARVIWDHGDVVIDGKTHKQITKWSIPENQLERNKAQFEGEMSPGDKTAYNDRLAEYNDKVRIESRNR